MNSHNFKLFVRHTGLLGLLWFSPSDVT